MEKYSYFCCQQIGLNIRTSTDIMNASFEREDAFGIPYFMSEAKGEKPYLYYDETDKSVFIGQKLDMKLSRCGDSIELYNIASFINPSRIIDLKKILNHPCCDKAIALMIYWRSQNIPDAHELQEEILNRLKSNHYPEILSYNPKNDKYIDVNWGIK